MYISSVFFKSLVSVDESSLFHPQTEYRPPPHYSGGYYPAKLSTGSAPDPLKSILGAVRRRNMLVDQKIMLHQRMTSMIANDVDKSDLINGDFHDEVIIVFN